MLSKVDIFFSCSQEPNDEKLRNELEKHLGHLIQEGHINVLHRGKIDPRVEKELVVKTHLNKAHIILLLISADFITSETCYQFEMKRAMERHRLREARVVPIILRPVSWKETPIGILRALPTNEEAITEWDDRDKAFLNVVNGIRNLVEELCTPPLNPLSIHDVNQSDVTERKSENLDKQQSIEQLLGSAPNCSHD